MISVHIRCIFSAAIIDLREAVDRLEIGVDADDLAEVFRLRELLLAKAMTPVRESVAAQPHK